ncbi:hypothetical protein KY349_04840 [Candidatus Woesearchaeota archaeon]|nr:hypothetical protein [Candidatus Woesearchaeota archaeon]
MIDGFVNKFMDNQIDNVVKIRKEYYQIFPELNELMGKVNKNLNRDPFSAGVFLGVEKGKEFRPSIALLDMVGVRTEKLVVVDDKAEWLFLCGRDVFAQSVVDSRVKSGPAIVLNKRKEVLGYGDVVGDMAKRQQVYLKNILDKGDFLRREMRKRR